MHTDEEAFEKEIVAWLTKHGGYEEGTANHFDAGLGLDTAELAAFIGATQSDEWGRLVRLHGADTDTAYQAFYQRLIQEINRRGTVDVLRHGVIDHGVCIRLAYFRPAHGLTPALVKRYGQNRLTVTRQVQYESGSTKTVDLVLFVNGLPVATAELKNQLTSSGADDAKRQYRNDRDPKNLTLSRRALVHFAVDTMQVAMTTKLAGAKTQFLPFNRGDHGGAGNPAPPAGSDDEHRSAYLWREVWSRDNWMDLLQRFIHVDKPSKNSTKRTVIFPRYHQWDAVRLLEAAARREGAGHDYLVEHSAGSGKSNTIAWLAHRLASLHDDSDRAVFDKVVVITDRTVLDKQLQDNIYQLDHVSGVVKKITKDSRQLAEALTGKDARVIITTLQKFPVVEEQGEKFTNRRYAVIVDEAHSGQSGESVTDLRAVLGSAADDVPDDAFNAVLERRAKARGKQPNISFFAFTATPRGETLQKFGVKSPVSGEYEPHHLYSMRQAIEEGFILDVLANYMTYQTYWNIQKAIEDDPRYDSREAKAAIARFVSLHEVNLAQKAEIIIEHFRRHIRHKIGGKAKAMVVTQSRQHAIRYQQALRQYCREHGYDIGVLVAFSGRVPEGEGADAPAWTESKLNGFPDSQTKDRFEEDGNHILVVADKYQTGYDQPLLYAMYVDRTLEGLNAVQTLSRLNRTIDGKDGTFVLHFRNEAEVIQASFAPWYTTTVARPADPNLMYDARDVIDQYGVVKSDEAERLVTALLAPAGSASHGRVHAALTPAIDRFRTLDEGEQDEFRGALATFLRAYAFLAQVVQFTDAGLERDYLFGKALSSFIRPDGGSGLDLGSEVELTAIRNEETFSGSISLDPDTHGEVSVFLGGGLSSSADPDMAPLSEIVVSLNDRYGTDFAEDDFVRFFGGVAERLAAQQNIQEAAAANTPENFQLVLAKAFEEQVAAGMTSAQDMALRYFDDPELQRDVLRTLLPFIQGRAIAARQEYCPIGDLLGPDLEGLHLEYKGSLRTLKSGALAKSHEKATLKTIAAFANSRDGGTLLLGVDDAGTPCGLAGDYASLRRRGKNDRDQFQLHLINIVSQSMGAAAAAIVSVQFHTVDGHDICRVHVRPSAVPVEAEVSEEKNGQTTKKTVFYARTGNSTSALNPTERAKYVLNRWLASGA